jgi:hypothetical protein
MSQFEKVTGLLNLLNSKSLWQSVICSKKQVFKKTGFFPYASKYLRLTFTLVKSTNPVDY